MSKLDDLYTQLANSGNTANKAVRSEFKPLILDDDTDTKTQDIDTDITNSQSVPQYVDVDKPKFVQPQRRSYYVAGNVNNNEINTTAQRPNEIEYEANTIDDEKKKDNYFGLSKLITSKKDIVKNVLKYVVQAPNLIQNAANTVGMFTGKSGEDVIKEGVRGFAGSTVDFASSLARFVGQNYMYFKGYTAEQLDKITNLGNVVAGGESFSDEIKQKYTDFYNRIDEQTQEFKDKTERFLEYSGIAKTDKDGFIYDLVGGGASLMYAIGIAAITKSPAAAAEMFGAYQYQSLYEEGIANGFSAIKARTIGVAGGVAEGALELVGLHVLIETLAARKSFMKILKAAATEFIQEASQQGAEEFLAKLSGMREEGLLDILKNVGYAGLIGALIGGGSATVSNVFYKQISDGATKELISKGVNSEYAKQMVNNMLNFSVSPQVANEVVGVIKDEQSPVTYKNADPRETYKEFGDTVKKALDPQQKRGVELEFIEANKKLTQEYANALLSSGKIETQDEAYRQAETVTAFYDTLAREAYNQDNILPQDYYKRFHVNANSGNIETDERNIDDSNVSLDDSFEPIDFDEAERAKYEAEIEGYEDWLADEQKRSGIKNNFETQKNILADMGIGKIRKPAENDSRYSEYNGLSARIKNSFFTDVPTAMTWDEAEQILQQHNGDSADIFEYFRDIDLSVPVGQESYLQKDVFSKVLAKEREDIKNKAIADGTFLKAPNGKDSNLPEQLWLTVRTKAFKNWFGDWENDPQNASKVVDENGEPLVVYHGTANDFSVFDKNKSYQGLFWFSNDYNKVNAGYDGATGKGIVMPVFLNIKNAADWDLYDKYSPEELENMKYDGLLLKDGNETVAVAFDNKQIKSINNRGSFDRNNADIYYQRVAVPTNRADRNNYAFKISAKDLVEARTREEIQDKLQKIFGTYEDLEVFSDGEDVDVDEIMFVLSNEFMADLEYAANNRDYTETQALLNELKKALLEISKLKDYNNVNETGKEESNNLSDASRSGILRTEKSAERNLRSDAATTAALQVKNLSLQQLKEINDNIVYKLVADKYSGNQDYIAELEPQTAKFFKDNGIKNVDENGVYVDIKVDTTTGEEKVRVYSIDEIEDYIESQKEEYPVELGFKDRTTDLKKQAKKLAELQNKFDVVQDKLRAYIAKNSPKVSPQQQSQVQLKADMQQPMLDIFYQAAYHGTPHRFDTFSTEKIGTGEGAQAHGWGLYFAKERAVSEDYRKNLTNNDGTIYVDGKEIEDKNFGEDFYARRNTIKGKTLKEKLLNYKDKLVERIDWNNKNIEHLTKQIPLYEKLVKELRKNKTADKTEIEDILEKNSDGIKTDVIAAWQDLLDAADDPYEQMNTEEGYDNELNSENVASYFEGEIFDKQSQIKQSEKDINNFEKKLKTIESIDLDNAELKGYGQVFQVDIPEDNVLLDEDKRFHEQPEKVQEALNKIFKEIYKTDKKEFINYIDKKYANHEKHDAIIKELKKVIDGTKDNGSAVLANLDYDDAKKLLFLYRSGRYIYGEIEDRLGSDKAASLILNKYGIKGIKYNGGWDGRAYVVFDDKAVKVLEKYYQEQQSGARGATTVYDRQYFIDLFANSDKSTLLHETSHVFLSEILYFAQAKNASKKVLDIKAKLDDWLGVPENNGRYSTEQQELFAASAERFFMEGKAPTPKLKTVFERFKVWLSNIYDRIKDDLPKISDDVRSLFDAILSRSYDVPDSNIYAGKEKAIKEVIKNVQEGRASEVDGITIDDVYNLLKMAYTRKPSKPSKNLKTLLNDKNIYDFNELSKAGNERVLQILKDGGYVKPDATAEQAVELAKAALDGKSVYRLADAWRVAGDVDFARNLRVLEKVIEFSQIDSVMEKILELQQEGYRNVEQGDVEQVKSEYRRLMDNEDVKEAKKIVEDIINRLYKKKFMDKAAQKQMINDLKFSATVEEIRESVLNVIEDLQDEVKAIKEQLKNPRKPVVRKDKTIPPGKNATEEEKNNYKKYMRKQINRLLKQALPRKQNQQKFSKFDEQTQRFFTDLEKYNKMTIEQAQQELYSRATSIIDEEGVGLDNYEKMKNMFLSYKANKVDQNSTEFYKQLYDNLQQINVFGRNAKDIQNTLKKEQIQKDIDNLVVNIENNKSKNVVSTGVKKQYIKWLGNWWSTINAIAGKKQADKDSLERIEIDIFNKDYEITENLKTKCAAALGLKNATDLDMTVNAYLNQEYTYQENDPRSNTSNAVKLNKMQLICCYIWMKNSNLKERIVRAYGNEQIMDMMSKLTIQDQKFGDELQQSVAALYDDVNAVYLKMYGLDMPQAENYFPSSVERIQGNMDLLKDNIGQVSSPGFIKARVESNLPLMNFGNPVKMALDHIAKVNHFVYMQEKLADLNKVYKTTVVKRHITNAYGDRVYRYILQVLDNAKFTTVARTIDGISDVGDYLVNNYVLTKIAIKPSIMIKQLLSCINYAEDMSSVKWFEGFLKGVATPKKTIDFMMKNSKYCQSRFAKGGQTEALLKAMEGSNATFAKVKTFKGMLSWMTRVGDIGAIIFGGYPYVQEQMSKGVSLKTAIENFERSTIRSQQASLPSTLSNFQYRGMNSWLYRAMFAFANTPNQYSRKIGDTMYMYFHGDINKKQFAKNLMIYGVLNSLMYTSFTSLAILSGLVSGDWDDLKDDIIMSLMQCSNVLALPIVSQAYNSFVSKVVTGDFTPDKEIPLLDDMVKIMRTATKEDLEMKDYLTIIDEVVSLVFGVPVKTLYNEFVGSTKDLLDGEYGKFAVKLYGATESRANKIFDN